MLPVFASLFFGFVPMFIFAVFIYWLDRFEKEPKTLLAGVFTWGVLIAAGGAFIVNTLLGAGVYILTNSDIATELTTGSIIAPLVEETLKGLAVLIVFLVFRHEFDSVLDGIIYAAIVALGFAATENAYYIYSYGYAEGGWSGFWFLVFVRVVLVGLQHPFYTAFIGIGLAVARVNKHTLVRLAAPLIGWSVAVFSHSLHNTLAATIGGYTLGCALGTLLDWSGWLAMAGFALWALWHEARYLKQHLAEEVALGIISEAQYKTASSALAQFMVISKSILQGRYWDTVHFYQNCGELAHKKQQYLTLGNETRNAAIIEELRQRLLALSPRANAN